MTARHFLMGMATICLLIAFLLSVGASIGALTVTPLVLLAAVFVGASLTVSA